VAETARAQNARELEAKLADRLRKGAATAVRANSKEKREKNAKKHLKNQNGRKFLYKLKIQVKVKS